MNGEEVTDKKDVLSHVFFYRLRTKAHAAFQGDGLAAEHPVNVEPKRFYLL